MMQKDKILSDKTPDAENEMWATEIWGFGLTLEVWTPAAWGAENCWAIRKIHSSAENVKATFKPQPGGT